MPYMGKLDSPITIGRAEPVSPFIWGLLVRTTQVPLRHMSRALSWHSPIYDLLELVTDLVLGSHRCTIWMTWDNCRISKRSLGEGPILMADQKPESLNLNNNTINKEHLQIKLCGQKGVLHEPGEERKMEEWSFFFLVCFFCLCFKINILTCIFNFYLIPIISFLVFFCRGTTRVKGRYIGPGK